MGIKFCFPNNYFLRCESLSFKLSFQREVEENIDPYTFFCFFAEYLLPEGDEAISEDAEAAIAGILVKEVANRPEAKGLLNNCSNSYRPFLLLF